MTQQQFIDWLDGFLDAKEGNENEDLIKIREKLKSILLYNTHPPYVDGKGHPNPYYFATTSSDKQYFFSTKPDGTSTSTTYGYPSGSAWSYTSTSTQEKSEESTPQRQLLTENHD